MTMLFDWMRTIASYVFMCAPSVKGGMIPDSSGATHAQALHV
jgi:hypothetical protein